MANDNFDWESYINFDSSELPFAGSSMQGGEAEEDGCTTAHAGMGRQSVNQDYQPQHLCVDPFWPRDSAHAAVGIDHGDNTEWSSTEMRNSLEWSSQQYSDQQCSLDVANLAQYHNDGSSEREIGLLGAIHGFHPLNHNYAIEGIGEHNNGGLHEAILTQPRLVTPSTTSLITNAVVGLPPENMNQKPCPCISCIEIGWPFYGRRSYDCRFPGCHERQYYHSITKHERSHFLEEDRYICKEDYCNFNTKRWTDLKRHSSSKHCANPMKKFSCPIPWCKYTGKNGFARKDKLNSHYKAVHGGKPHPGKANQAIKPKVTGGA